MGLVVATTLKQHDDIGKAQTRGRVTVWCLTYLMNVDTSGDVVVVAAEVHVGTVTGKTGDGARGHRGIQMTTPVMSEEMEAEIEKETIEGDRSCVCVFRSAFSL